MTAKFRFNFYQLMTTYLKLQNVLMWLFLQEFLVETLMMLATCIVAGLAEGGTVVLLLHTFEHGAIRLSDIITFAGIIALFLAAQ